MATVEDPKILSSEEVAAAKAEIIQDVGEDEFEDSAEHGKDDDGNFPVTEEEISLIRAELACEFPDDYTYLSDAYVKSVASKPYSKDPTIRRPLEYSIEKLSHVMQWREQAGAPDLIDMVNLANGPESAPEAVAQPDTLVRAKAVVTALNYGSLYWHGFTKEGKPILWIRTARKPWYPDVDAEIKALIIMADAGIKNMPENVTDFVVVSDSTSPPPPNPSYMIALLKGLVRGYPDRLSVLVSAPISSIIQFVMKILLPLMPGRLSQKVVLCDVEGMKEHLKGMLLHGEKDVPTFFGGPSNHDQWYPDEAYCPNRGKGCLKFDYFGMVDRLEKAREEYQSMQANGDAK